MRVTRRDIPVLFFAYLLPLAALFGLPKWLGAAAGVGTGYVAVATLTLAILSSGLWGATLRPRPAREAGLRWCIGGALMGLAQLLPMTMLLLWVAHARFALPVPADGVALAVAIALAALALRAIGLLLIATSGSTLEAVLTGALLYLPIVAASGIAIPAAGLPAWFQTAGGFLPGIRIAHWLHTIFFHHGAAPGESRSAAAFLAATGIGLFAASRLLRREEGASHWWRDKLWVLAALAPFLALGAWDARTGEQVERNRADLRDLERCGTFLIRDVRIFPGEGRVIETGYVLVRDGKIARMGEGAAPDAVSRGAEIVEGSGKTLLPGLIDAHVHLGAPAAPNSPPADYETDATLLHSAAALLASGVTAARSTGDPLDASLALRRKISSGRKLGARIFVSGAMFTAAGARPTEFLDHLPEARRDALKARLTVTPRTPEEARRQVRAMQSAGVDGVKSILEAGWGETMLADRLDLLLARSVAEEAHALRLPLAVHTGDARDVTDAVEIGASSIEHGSWRDDIPDRVLEHMAAGGVFLDPMLGVIEAYYGYYSGDGAQADADRAAMFEAALEQARGNLVSAWKAGVPLVVGTDAGNPRVFPGPSLHHELQLWVQAGIPPEVALQAATANAARLLGTRAIGAIREGADADLLLVDGNPLVDIAATERISLIVFQGERLRPPIQF